MQLAKTIVSLTIESFGKLISRIEKKIEMNLLVTKSFNENQLWLLT